MNQPMSIPSLLRHPIASSVSLESSALLVGAAVFFVAAITATIAFLGRSLSISGPGSIGQFVALGSAIATTVVFVVAGVLRKSSNPPSERGSNERGMLVVRVHWYDIGAVALSHTFIALLGWLGVADLMHKSFSGAVVYALPAVVLAAAAIAVTAYAVFLLAVSLTPMLLSVILVLFLVVGTVTSMLSATDPLWWQKNLSSLGITDDISARAFNLTLIVAGVIVTTIAHYATATIPATSPQGVRGRNFVRGALVLIGVLLACVGIFPVDEFLTAHNVAASGMATVFVVMVISLRRAIPAMPRVFVLLGYVFVGVIFILAVFFATGYYNLTAVELVAFLLIFSWLIVFLRHTGAMNRTTEGDVAGRARQGESGRDLWGE